MGTKRNGESCYDKAALDEPLFVLRAQDATAPATVRFWYEQNPQLHHTAKGYECLDLIDAMVQWQNEKLRKLAD